MPIIHPDLRLDYKVATRPSYLQFASAIAIRAVVRRFALFLFLSSLAFVATAQGTTAPG
jgi:hypothetical protein